MAYLRLKHQRVYLHGIDTRDTYTNSIINCFFKAQNESYQMTYAVKTIEKFIYIAVNNTTTLKTLNFVVEKLNFISLTGE